MLRTALFVFTVVLAPLSASANLASPYVPPARYLHEPVDIDRALVCDEARRELADDRNLLLQKLAEAGAPATLLTQASGWTDLSLFVPLLDQYKLDMWVEWYQHYHHEVDNKIATYCRKEKS
ncbi:MAG TPA: hypothetical protein VHP58_03195 [Alphaproteobacteria bacterium]|nr:hypothetical protein [Alphaproteobacteria bacterium]